MKILQVNCVYDKGSTGKITHDLHHGLLEMGMDSVVCYGRGEVIKEPGIYKTCGELYSKVNNLWSRITGLMYGGCWLSTRNLIRIIEQEQPDIVHLQCINGYFVNVYKLVSWLKERRIKTVLTLHAEFMYTGNCGHALACEKWKTGCGNCPRLQEETKSVFFDRTAKSHQLMYQAFSEFETNLTVISVSPWLKNRAEESRILKNMQHRVILNGVDTHVFTYNKTLNIREKYGIREEKIVFQATPDFSDVPDHLKGGWYLLELAKKMPDVRFLVAGRYRVAEQIPKNVTLLGEIRDRKLLAACYAAADLTVLTSKRETFSMVCAESLCCGTPVVGFKAGAPEMISLPGYSEFTEQGDTGMLKDTVERWLQQHVDKEVLSTKAKKCYAEQRMLEEYISCYKGMGI